MIRTTNSRLTLFAAMALSYQPARPHLCSTTGGGAPQDGESR